jgi:hypothetical protein
MRTCYNGRSAQVVMRSEFSTCGAVPAESQEDQKKQDADPERELKFWARGDHCCFDDIPTAWPSNDNILQMNCACLCIVS